MLYLIKKNMKKEVLYITSGVYEILRKDNTIIIVKEEWTKTFPIEIIDALYIYTDLKISTQLLGLLNKYNIQIYFHWYYWNYIWSYFPKENNVSGAIIVEQVKNFTENSLFYSKKLMYSAFSNMLKVLDRHKDKLDKDILQKMKDLRDQLIYNNNIQDINTLMWLEWIFRNFYYSQFSKCIKNNNFIFNERNRQPPKDPVNSLMSLLNMNCYNLVNDSIIKSQLSPFISFYHSMNQKRYNLSLDIAEIFKPILVDRLILKLLNNNMLKKSDFIKDKSIWLVKLKDDTYKKVMLEWNNSINEYLYIKSLWKKYNWKSIIQFECYKIMKYWNDKNYNLNFYILYWK